MKIKVEMDKVILELTPDEYTKLKIVVNGHARYSHTAKELNDKLPLINFGKIETHETPQAKIFP